MTQTIIRALTAALLASLIVLVAFTCIWIESLNRVTVEFPIIVQRESGVTRSLLIKQVGLAAEALNRQITGLRQDVRGMERDLGRRAEEQISAGISDLNTQLTTLNATIDRRAGEVTVPASAAINAIQDLAPPTQHILDNTSQTPHFRPIEARLSSAWQDGDGQSL